MSNANQRGDEYQIRRADRDGDSEGLRALYQKAFPDEGVDTLAAVMYRSLPGMTGEHWIVAEHKGEIVAGSALIPWTWIASHRSADGRLTSVELSVAEQGIVGTHPGHRGLGLMRRINNEFDGELISGGYHLAGIQGIPGFYQKFGYRYALPLESHLELELRHVSRPAEDTAPARIGTLRAAGAADIDRLIEEDVSYRSALNFSTLRTREQWDYIFGPGKDTEYVSDMMIFEGPGDGAYIRISREGFGTGLIVSEISWDIRAATLDALLPHLADLARERGKPYIRFNLPPDCRPARMLIARGARFANAWAWQMKIPDLARYLRQMAPVLESRLGTSDKAGFSGNYRIGSFSEGVDLEIRDGRILSVQAGEGEAEHSLAMSDETLPQLLTGAMSLEDIRAFRPDSMWSSPVARRMTDALFPRLPSWLYLPY
jgi:GNAT superfamily N-acetyltransferase